MKVETNPFLSPRVANFFAPDIRRLQGGLGANPNTSSTGLTRSSASASSATFQHTLNPTIASDVSYSHQWSSDLTEWKASGEANGAGTIVPSAPVSGVVTVTTTRSGAASDKLFTRIKAGNS